jgi:hypothetical protein
MLRFLALIAGIALIGVPAWWLSGVIPLSPPYQKGSPPDYLFFVKALFAVYGGVALGIAVSWVRAQRSGRSLLPRALFKAGMHGMLAACIAFFAVHFVYGMMTHGDFEKAIGGNLWGLIVIFWAVLSALVSAGLALLLYAWRGAAGYSPGSGGVRGPWS